MKVSYNDLYVNVNQRHLCLVLRQTMLPCHHPSLIANQVVEYLGLDLARYQTCLLFARNRVHVLG